MVWQNLINFLRSLREQQRLPQLLLLLGAGFCALLLVLLLLDHAIERAAVIVGLVLLGLLAAFLLTRQKHQKLLLANQAQLKEEIENQTLALRKANDWLLKEIEQRQNTQEQLEQSQEILRRREQELRSLLDNIPDPVWLKDTQGRYLNCNRAFAQLLGKTEAEIVGRYELDLVSADIARAFRYNDRVALGSQQPYRHEQWLVAADGKLHMLDTLKLAVRDLHEQTYGILGIGRDITDKHELITELAKAKEAAEEAARAKSRFLANMSHEIRTPLNAVLGYTQLLMRDSQLAGSQRERLQLILSASQRLLGLINDILDLSKIESGALNLRQEYFDLQQEVSDILSLVRERAEVKGLQLHAQLALPSPFIARGDRQKIGQILLNLLGNALKFTQQGSVSLAVNERQDEVEFVISDTGPGISAAELAELFSAFKQGRSGEDSGGTGLGLTLSRHLAEAMGGSLRLTSAPGEGTQALLRLPLRNEPVMLGERVNMNHAMQLAPGQSINALVVEDDRASCDILVDLLRQIGCRVSAAGDGQAGLALCQQRAFDIVFTDIRMPGMNGLEMFQRLRALKAYSTVPIIAVSASSLEHERSFYLQQGFQEFIGKPYAFDDVFAALRRFAGASFVGEAEPAAPVPEVEEDSPAVDLAQVQEQLQQLLELAASGDMSGCKKILRGLTQEQLGRQRHQQLQQALQQYDLVRMEGQIKQWLGA